MLYRVVVSCFVALVVACIATSQASMGGPQKLVADCSPSKGAEQLLSAAEKIFSAAEQKNQAAFTAAHKNFRELADKLGVDKTKTRTALVNSTLRHSGLWVPLEIPGVSLRFKDKNFAIRVDGSTWEGGKEVSVCYFSNLEECLKYEPDSLIINALTVVYLSEGGQKLEVRYVLLNEDPATKLKTKNCRDIYSRKK